MPSPAPHDRARTTGHSRRTLAKAGLAAAVGVGAIGTTVRLTQHDDGDRGAGALVLSADDGSDVAALEVPLDLGPASGGARETAALPTTLYSMVGVTWRGTRGAEVWARARRSSGWTAWTRLPLLDDRPDDDSWQADRRGTAAWWVGPSRSVQVRVVGAVPPSMRLVLMHPARREGDGQIGLGIAAGRSATDDVTAPRPDISTRAQWGADESWRDGRPRYESTIEQVHVHHTASGNDYSREDTPALIRGMYRYHTKSLGWSDIAYNVLVDRFGRIWEGRAGGIARPVRGAHTLGFNSDSCGISVIGNFNEVKVPDVVVRSVAAVAAWKLDAYGRKARGTTTVRSEGSDRYREGAMATLRVIDGHRDTNDTSCPGSNLYDRLPDIRARAHEIMTSPPPPSNVVVQEPSKVGGAALVGRGLTAVKGRYDPEDARSRYQWLRRGEPIAGQDAWRYQCREADLGLPVAVRVTTSAPGRDPVVEVVEAGRVQAPVDLEVKTRRRGGRVRAKVSVTQPSGISVEPTGTVTLSIGDRVAEVRLRDLDKPVWFGRGKPLRDRATQLRVVYSGDKRFQATELRRTVRA